MKSNNLKISNILFGNFILNRNLVLNHDKLYEVSDTFLDSVSAHLYKNGHEIIVFNDFNKDKMKLYLRDNCTFIYNGDVTRELLEHINNCLDYNSFNIGICTNQNNYYYLKRKYELLRDKMRLQNILIEESEDSFFSHRAYILSYRK